MHSADTSTGPDRVLKSIAQPRRLASLRAIMAMMLREMASSYGRSPGGYLWAILEPAAGILLLALLFSLAFDAPPLGQNFSIFYATGVVPFFAFNEVANKTAAALQYSRQLLAYPRVTFMDAILGRFLLNFLTQMLVGYVVLSGILLLFETRTLIDFPGIALAYAMLAALCFGVGTLNCFLFLRFPVWQRAWAIITRPLMIVSGVIFLFATIPEPYRGYLWYNPLIHIIGQMRKSFYISYSGDYVSPAYVIGFGLCGALIGLLFLRRYYRDLLTR
ncbi:ABC transporter permease [Shimia sp.]|uniref:ABC transporter permease n=1 Tax=Shimia sp. TaxID=1954381 RepID=UPI0035656829